MVSVDANGAAVRIIDDVRDAVTAALQWPNSGALPDVSLEGACKRAALGRSVTKRIHALDRHALSYDLRQTLDVLSLRAEFWSLQEDWYWTVFDPGGSEMFGMFAPTPYCGGMMISSWGAMLRRLPLDREVGQMRYLAGLHELGDVLVAFGERTRGQAERGIFMPRAQAEAAKALLGRLEAAQLDDLCIKDDRLVGADAFKRNVEATVKARIVEGIAAMNDVLDTRYFGHVRNEVGLMHYPDGPDIYAALVRLHGSTDLSPAQVHEVGLERMAKVRGHMAKARKAAGFSGNDREYRDHIANDPAWRAQTPADIQRFFERYIDRFRPHVDRLFNVRPKADYGVRPLPEAMSAALTFGYYDMPSEADPRGDYVFNAQNLAQEGMFKVAGLNYHELVPGHHLHLALQNENQGLPAVRQWCMPTAYVEGWAEYGVSLAEEAGMFQEPPEQFGRLTSEAFLVARLVVDTGMNALGWSLEQARTYMRDNSFFPENQLATETLRYSSDIPGQALAYKLGDYALMAMREKMRAALGDRFDVRDFHDAVLSPGAMPLPLLARHIEHVTAQRMGA